MHESEQIGAEHRDVAAHAHSADHRKEDQSTRHESSTQALEHSNPAYLRAQQPQGKARTVPADGSTSKATEHDIAALAYWYWQARGRPAGSPEEDWFRAVKEIESAA